MAIDRIGGPQSFGTGGVDETAKRARPEGSAAEPSDSLDLSDAARRGATLSDRARELPDVREQRVEALRRQLEDGTYSVDPRKIARAMLELEDAIR